MWPTNIPATQRDVYLDACLHRTTRTRLQVDLLTLEHRHVQSLDYDVVDGQVNHTPREDIDLALQMGFADSDGDLFDLDVRHLIQVRHELYVPSLDLWASAPQGTFVPVVVSADGDQTVVEAHGKESLALRPGAPRDHAPEGRRVARVIRKMFEQIGETRFRISPGLDAEIDARVAWGGPDPKAATMRVARRLGNRAGYQVFYDELGRLVVRERPQRPVMTWREPRRGEDDGATGLQSPVRFTRDLREIRNVVRASGKGTLKYEARPPWRHAWHPRHLARGDWNGEVPHYWDAPSVGDRPVLRRRADRILDRLLTDRVAAELDCTPTYHNGSYDRLSAEKANGRVADFWPPWSRPLGAGLMSVGYTDRRRKLRAGRIDR